MTITAKISYLFRTIFSYVPVSRRISAMNYEHYWQLRGHSILMPRYVAMANCIPIGARVLDLGCGEGTFASYVKNNCGAKVIGVDISRTALQLAYQKGVPVLEGDITDANFFAKVMDYGPFDFVTISEVLEHIQNPESVIQQASKLSPKLLITIPNIAFFPHRIRLFFGKFPLQWEFHPAEHIRFWSVSDFKRWCKELNLIVERAIPTNGFPLIFRFWPNLFANQVVFVLKKKE